MTWADEFLAQNPSMTLGDLKQQIKMKKAQDDLSKILDQRNMREKQAKINKEIQKLVFG